MSKASPQLFTLTLRDLSSDGKKAGAGLPRVELPYSSAQQIHALLTSVAALAPTVVFPAEPEIRIKREAREFVVRVSSGQLHFVSWSSSHKSGVATPDEIVAAITGQVDDDGGTNSFGGRGGTVRGLREKLTILGLGVAIVAVNLFTIWFITRPPRTIVAEYRPIAPKQAERILAEVAGVYETGKNAGDRRLEIAPPSIGKRLKFGAKGAVKEAESFDVKPVESGGSHALLTSKKSLIKIKDSVSVVLYGDTYTRVNN